MQKTIEFRRFYTLTYNSIVWNGHDPILGDKRVRRALAMCIDLKSIINNLYHGTARAMNGPFTPDQWAYNPTVPVIPFDPEGARRLLNATGWLDTNGDGILEHDGRPLSLELAIFAGSSSAIPFAQLFQAQLKAAGVKLEIAQLEPSVFIQRVLAGNFQAAYMGWDLDPDPDPFPSFHSSQFPPRGQNVAYYANPEADRLIDAGRRELELSKRTLIYQKLHELLAADQPHTWTVQVSSKWGIRRRVKNVKESRGYGLFLYYPGELGWWLQPGK